MTEGKLVGGGEGEDESWRHAGGKLLSSTSGPIYEIVVILGDIHVLFTKSLGGIQIT